MSSKLGLQVNCESKWKNRYSKQRTRHERKEHSTRHKTEAAELGVARDGIEGSRKDTLRPVHQTGVLEIGPVGMGLEQGMTSSSWHCRWNSLTTVEAGLGRGTGRGSDWKWESVRRLLE